jgi:alpha-glucosidase
VLPEGAWPNWVLGNHDISRIATRGGPGSVRLAQMLLLTLRGTPTCYYGDELGLADGEIPPERVVDPQAAAGRTRDPARTPMPWTPGPNAGFAPPGAEPWLPLAAGHEQRNVATQDADPRSELSLFRRLVALRREQLPLVLGSVRLLAAGEDDDVLAYVREHDGQRLLVALRLGSHPTAVDVSDEGASGEVLCATGLDREGAVDLGALQLGAHEGVIVRLA